MKQEAMNLKESKEKHMKQFGGSKGKGKWFNYIKISKKNI